MVARVFFLGHAMDGFLESRPMETLGFDLFLLFMGAVSWIAGVLQIEG